MRFLAVSALALTAFAADFSHKQHAEQNVACSQCHTNPGTGKKMGIAGCRSCHPSYRVDPKREQIYELPYFVWFSHRRHKSAACSTCHGPVEQQEELTAPLVDINMKFCRACHVKTGAKNVCGTCHYER